MKLLFINGSPKRKGSASEVLLHDLQTCLDSGITVSKYSIWRPVLPDGLAAEMDCADAVVFAFPLYVDGIPAQLLQVLCELNIQKAGRPGLPVYGMVNCGFYEGTQNAIALDILRGWCQKTGFVYGGGLGFGGGGALSRFAALPLGKGAKKPLKPVLQQLADAVSVGKVIGNLYCSIGMPRFFYKTAGEIQWKSLAKKNGLAVRNLKNKA